MCCKMQHALCSYLGQWKGMRLKPPCVSGGRWRATASRPNDPILPTPCISARPPLLDNQGDLPIGDIRTGLKWTGEASVFLASCVAEIKLPLLVGTVAAGLVTRRLRATTSTLTISKLSASFALGPCTSRMKPGDAHIAQLVDLSEVCVLSRHVGGVDSTELIFKP